MPQKVLVIEDSATSQKMLQQLVKKAGFTPIGATSLAQARHVFDESVPENFLCALVDFNLPDAPNGEAIDYAIESYLPTVVITGRTDDETREYVLSKAVVDYIPKQNAQVYDYLSRLLARLQKNKQVGVLVVDSSRTSRNHVLSLLRRHNFIPYEAGNAEQAIALLNRHREIKLVITEDNLPTLSGSEMVATIRQQFSKEELGIIGLSSSQRSALSARFIKSGANDFLNLPYCHEEFFCRVVQNVEYIENIEAIRRAANSDYLTGLPNRRHFFNRVERELQVNPAHQSLALIDLDYFKQVNDTYGHDAGDKVLKAVAKILASMFSDYQVARFGGEEFCVFMTDTPLSQAKSLMERFRQQVEGKVIKHAKSSISCTVSIGLTDHYSKTIESMLTRADKHLYMAKQQGRNCIVSQS
ncbi:response regulator [Aestuariibacter salexigens]|uniref:response regulator n=1 Tax=Aestuariibacter salexigens TaxID=226010 RepID=UPI00041316A8|nr:response regulator [Aestuariibacter salexigens]